MLKLLIVAVLLFCCWGAERTAWSGVEIAEETKESVVPETPGKEVECTAFQAFQNPRVVKLLVTGTDEEPARVEILELANRGCELRPVLSGTIENEYMPCGAYSTSDGRFLITLDDIVANGPSPSGPEWSLTSRAVGVYDLLRGTRLVRSLEELFGPGYLQMFDGSSGAPSLKWRRAVYMNEEQYSAFVELELGDPGATLRSFLKIDFIDLSISKVELSDTASLGVRCDGRESSSLGVIWWRAKLMDGGPMIKDGSSKRRPKYLIADYSEERSSEYLQDYLGGDSGRREFSWDEQRGLYVVQDENSSRKK